MRIILASNNQNKLREMSEILLPFGCEVISQSQAGVDIDVEETGSTFEENAALKAEAFYRLTSQPVISDDSGLEVDALGGEPGVYSARYGGEEAKGRRKELLLSRLEGVSEEKRTARFVCVIHYIDGEGQSHSFRGECEGRISFEKRGEMGFGYDPVFIPESHYSDGLTFAQIPAEEKNELSHRGKALKMLAEYIKENDNVKQ